MPRKSDKQTFIGQHFRWLIYQRGGRYYADGRSGNKIDVGRHSLDTSDAREAIENARQLDLHRAVKFGLAHKSLLNQDQDHMLPLADGVKQYLDYVRRPAVSGGAGKRTVARYKAVFDKFVPFAEGRGVRHWQAVNKAVADAYAGWLDDADYAYATEYLELTTIKQALNWMIGDAKLLPASCAFAYPLKKPVGTTTYCYTPAEVGAMLARCAADQSLRWLGDVIAALVHTGLRISELAALRWSDLDAGLQRIELVDEQRTAAKAHRAVARTTKTHRDRTLPVHPALCQVLAAMSRHPDGRVFHGPNGGVLKPDTVRNILQRDVLKPLSAQFPAAPRKPGLIDGRLHSFRHYFCSVAAGSGKVDAETLMTWLGHRDSRMVRHYFHAFEDRGARQMESIDFAGPSAATLAPAGAA